MDEDDFPLHPVPPWRDLDRSDDRPFVNLRPGGEDDDAGDGDTSLDRTLRAEATCAALGEVLTRGGFRTGVVASERGAPREDACVQLEVTGPLDLKVLVGEGAALLTTYAVQDRAFDVEEEFARVRAVIAAVEQLTGWLPVRPEMTVEDPHRRALVRAGPGWHRGMPDGPPPMTVRQIVAAALAERRAAPPKPAGRHPEVVARLRRDVEDAVARGARRWEERWTVTTVREDVPWLELLEVDGVRVSAERPPVSLTLWVEGRDTLWARLERDGLSTTDEVEDRAEALRVVRAVVDETLTAWTGRLPRRSEGWQVKDRHRRLRLHATLVPVGPPPGSPQTPAG